MTILISQFVLLLVLFLTILIVAGIAGVAAGALFDTAGSRLVEGAEAIEKGPPPPVDPKVRAARRSAYRLGLVVFVGLAVLTILEFVIARVTEGSTVLLFVVALVKAGLILQYYMHLNSVMSTEEDHR
jgi:hypothetical protein